VLDRLVAERGAPDLIVMDNGPEFTSRALDAWAYERGVRLHFIQPGKPTQNCFVESFNGKFRDECLNENWFGDIPRGAMTTALCRAACSPQRGAEKEKARSLN
jgi:putative transposase